MLLGHAPPQEERPPKKDSEGFGKDRFKGAVGEQIVTRTSVKEYHSG